MVGPGLTERDESLYEMLESSSPDGLKSKMTCLPWNGHVQQSFFCAYGIWSKEKNKREVIHRRAQAVKATWISRLFPAEHIRLI